MSLHFVDAPPERATRSGGSARDYKRDHRQRGTTTQRGYGVEHRKMREEFRPSVEAGLVDCWRCGKPIKPRDRWDLGHDDNDKSIYRGPEHSTCNRATRRHERNQQPLNASEWWAQ